MPKTRLMLCVLTFCIVWASSNGYGADELVKHKAPDKDVIKAWKDAGAKYVYAGFYKANSKYYTTASSPEELINPIPAFSFRDAPKGFSIATLPDPKVPFGISFSYGTDAEEIFKGIGEYENLRALCLSMNGTSDKAIKVISGLKKLEYLDIALSGISDEGMKDLVKIKTLKYLDLSNAEITDKGFFQLGALENLEALVMLPCMPKFPEITGAGLQGLAKSKKLRHLEIWYAKWTDADLAAIKDLTDLEAVEIPSKNLTFGGLKNLLGMKKMKRLDISEIPLAPDEMKQLVNAMPDLERVQLSHVNINDECIEELAKLKKLNYLYLSESSVSAKGLKPLAKCDTLEMFYCCPHKFPEYLKHIGELKSLKILWLQTRESTDTEMKEIAKLPKLEELQLWNSKITDKGLEELERIKTLKKLDLSYTPTTIDGINALRKALPACKVIKSDVKID